MVSRVRPRRRRRMTLDERFELCRSVGEECVQEDELRNLLDKKPVPVCYDGFEPSGRMHIAQGVMVGRTGGMTTTGRFLSGGPGAFRVTPVLLARHITHGRAPLRT